MTKKITQILFGFLMVMTVYLTFLIRSYIEAALFQISELQYQIDQERNNIQILKTEITVLSSHGHIRKLASQYLKLQECRATDFISNVKTRAPLTSVASNKLSHDKAYSEDKTKWRYKKPIYSNIHNASNIRKTRTIKPK